MAKLSVVIQEVGGQKYRKAERKAQAGDIVRAMEDGFDVTKGAFYAVYDNGIGGLSFDDDVSDKQKMDGMDFEVYEKVAEEVAQQYREVNRPAKVGERIKIVDASAYSDYENGNEFVVERVDTDGDVFITDNVGDEEFVDDCEYVVLEPINSAEPAPAPQPKRLTVGDYAKVVNPRSRREDKRGHIVEIFRDVHDRQPFRARSISNGEANWYFEEELVRATESEVAAAKHAPRVGEFADGGYAVIVSGKGALAGFESGDYVKVSANDGGHALKVVHTNGTIGYCNADALRKVTQEEYEAAAKPKTVINVGDTVKLTLPQGARPRFEFGDVNNGDIGKVHEVHEHRIVVDFPAQKRWNAAPSELTVISADEAAKPRLKVGELARTLVGKDVPEGAIVRITRDDRGDLPYRGELLDGSDYDWYRPSQLERVSEEEAKWFAIGRKVGEYKLGDIVEVTKSLCGHPVGTIGEIVSGAHFPIPREFGVKSCGATYDHTSGMKLIVPVEQRFDKAQDSASKGGASPSK